MANVNFYETLRILRGFLKIVHLKHAKMSKNILLKSIFSRPHLDFHFIVAN